MAWILTSDKKWFDTSRADVPKARQSPSVTPRQATLYASLFMNKTMIEEL